MLLLLSHRSALRCRGRAVSAAAAFSSVADTDVSAHYDLVVIGSGPAAQKCALESAKIGKKVAVVDKAGMIGGVCVHTGTIPSKTFRESVLHLTGFRHQGFYGRAYQPWRDRISVPDILMSVKKVEKAETDVVMDQLMRERVEIISGTARFMEGAAPNGSPRCMILKTVGRKEAESSIYRHLDADRSKMIISAEKYLIACGTRPLRPSHIPFDGKTIFDSDQILWGGVKNVPRDLIVVGAGVIGMEYASMINCIPGTTVSIIDPRSEVLGFIDRDVMQALQYSMRKWGARFLLGEKIQRVEHITSGVQDRMKVVAHLESGKRVTGDALLYTMGRQGNTDSLNTPSVEIEPDNRGLIKVNDFYQTDNPVIYACGDVIGYPALASTSMEQGRRAAQHMWAGSVSLDDDQDKTAAEHQVVKSVLHDGFLGRSSEQLFPYGIYTIPEISMVGKTEAQLTKEEVPYEVGIADYQELAKGQMLGGADGFLKLIFHAETLKLLGVHAIGEGATEIIHIGQVVMSQGGTIEYFRSSVFNYPTLAEAYNVAAVDGLRKVNV